ncbi:hypothetical protein BDW75DRAFT_237141 [Aspergillus navahoensis]
MWTTKAPILLFLLYNFQIKRWLRILGFSTLFVSAVCFLVGSSLTAVSYTPHGDKITTAFLAKCAEDSSTMGVFLGIVSVVIDVAILIMPSPVILRLQLPLRKKISLTLLFLTGVLAFAATAVSLAYKWLSRSGASTDMTSAMICVYASLSLSPFPSLLHRLTVTWIQDYRVLYCPVGWLCARYVLVLDQVPSSGVDVAQTDQGFEFGLNGLAAASAALSVSVQRNLSDYIRLEDWN